MIVLGLESLTPEKPDALRTNRCSLHILDEDRASSRGHRAGVGRSRFSCRASEAYAAIHAAAALSSAESRDGSSPSPRTASAHYHNKSPRYIAAARLCLCAMA